MDGPDHRASIEPETLRQLVDGGQRIAKAIGDGRKATAPCEQENRGVVRKSIVASKDLKAGAVLERATIHTSRPQPAHGISASRIQLLARCPAALRRPRWGTPDLGGYRRARRGQSVSWLRRIAVSTTTRAEFGLLRPLIHALAPSQSYQLQLFVGGTHLSKKFGHTIDEIEASGLTPTRTLDYLATAGDDASTGVIGAECDVSHGPRAARL